MLEDAQGERMQEEIAVLPFASYNLAYLAHLTGVEDTKQLVAADLCVGFCNMVAILCRELSIRYGLDETVNMISDESGIKSFLFDLSAFLGELECPHEVITCGPLEERLARSTRRSFLFHYLITEIKTALLYSLRQLEAKKQGESSTPFPAFVNSALNTLTVPKPSGTVTLADAVKLMHQGVEMSVQSVTRAPLPLFQPQSMNETRWKQVESAANSLAKDCRFRHLILLKRMDVTINSFLWSDRVKRKDDIRNLYSQRRDSLSQINFPGIADLLAANDLLLRIEPASGGKRRVHTRSTVKPSVPEQILDRGGRTEDIRGLRNETFAQQRYQENRGRGFHRGGRGHGGHRGGGHQQSHETMVRQEYSERNRGGHHGGHQRGGRGSRREGY